MNPAARTAFALPLDEFSKAIPAGVKRRLARCVEEQAGAFVSIKIGRDASLRCSVEILKLAGGEDGLIVAETTADSDFAPALPPPLPSAKGKARLKKPKPKARASGKPMSPPKLTVEEMRAFKAIGRKVRRLCEEKRAGSAKEAAAARFRESQRDALPAERADQALRAAIAAFDLALFLGGGLEIVRVEGRPRMGWRKASLIGRPVSELLPSSDRLQFQRMIEKLHRGAVSVRDSLYVLDGKGQESPCRAVVGLGGAAGAPFFFGVLSLELPARLKERTLLPARLAA